LDGCRFQGNLKSISVTGKRHPGDDDDQLVGSVKFSTDQRSIQKPLLPDDMLVVVDPPKKAAGK
jgi:hypothetical protein